MTDPNVTEARVKTAALIAAYLGEGWAVINRDRDLDNSAQTITHRETGRSLWLRWETPYGKNPPAPSISIHGNWPKDVDGRESFPRNSPSINVAAAKDPEKIAKDINRRFMPEYDKLWDEQAEIVQRHRDYADLTERTAAALEAAGARRSERSMQNGADKSNITLYPFNSHLYAITAQGGTVRIESPTSVPLDVMIKIMEVCRKKEEATD